MTEKKIKKTLGFTLIEALTLIFIFSLITITFYQVLTVGSRYIIDSKNRLGAVSLANERMEMVRNLSYNDIGVIDGQIDGNIPADQEVMENGKAYQVITAVEGVDDSLDGGYPGDSAFIDYKKVTITVSWGSGQVSLTSRFVPPGLEVADPNSGILFINVFSDETGAGISHSSVHIVNTETGLNTTLETDNSGNLTIMGNNVTQSIQKYQITVSKSGYETVSTMSPYPETPYVPTNIHASVIVGAVNVANIVQNQLTDLTIRTEDGLGQDIPNVNFSLLGGKMLGTDATPPYTPVYAIDDSFTTGADGEKNFNGIGPGQFIITPSISTGNELINIDPAEQFQLHAASPLTAKIRLAPKNITSLLVSVKKDDSGTLAPVAGAQVKLSNTATGGTYDTTIASLSNGAAYFPASSDEFLPGEYELKITADGFSDNTSIVTISQDELETVSVTLNP
ncbi:MAG TPA: hypothetical protein VK255_04420 [Patescibacteria group bacterium]|nr:hypothetical protein [Patescibacteria group bacterium]